MRERGQQQRRFGVSIPVTSLPGPEGIGTLGEPAERWLEWLASAGATAWQMLPLGPPGLGDSPYSAFSSFAGSPLLISTTRVADELWAWAALEELALDDTDRADPLDRIDYATVHRHRHRQLRALWGGFEDAPRCRRDDFESFREDERRAVWLDDWCLFAAISDHQRQGASAPPGVGSSGWPAWLDWPEELSRRDPKALETARLWLASEMRYHAFIQFLFLEQLESLREASRRLGIELLGDLPFYAGLDSADVWSRPELFALDSERRPTEVAGVPPDAFSADGQLWGNAVLRWAERPDDCQAYWIERARAGLTAADRLRLDHFRGFEAYWSVPATAPTAAEGSWRPGPGSELFEAAELLLDDLPFLAEDLGVITDEVRALLGELGIPGMRVLQFAISEGGEEHRPDQVPEDCVLCTATHDNDTARGWFDSLTDQERRRALDLLGPGSRPETFHHDLLRAALASRAEMVLAPVQDLLGLGSEARLNIPGQPVGQWRWRLESLPGSDLADEIQAMVRASGRRSSLGQRGPARPPVDD